MIYMPIKIWEALVYNFAGSFDIHMGNHRKANVNLKKKKKWASAVCLTVKTTKDLDAFSTL